MSIKEIDALYERLAQISREKDKIDSSYNDTIRKIEAMDDEVIQKNSALSYRVDEELHTNCDPKLMEIYQEREFLYRDMRLKTQEFDEELRAQYERRQQELEDEELTLRDAIAESEKESA